MRGMLLGVATSLALGAAPAIAADLPARTYTKSPAMVATISNWGGFYLGLNAGGAVARDCWTNTAAGASEGCHDSSGALAGGQIGYRWQTGGVVLGLEAQGDWANLKGSNASQIVPAATNQTKTDAVGLFTGQVGYAWNNVLWYVKGGAAVAATKYNGLTPTGTVFDRASETRWGGVVGTGIEVGFASNWSVAAEYDHIFTGDRTLALGGVPAGAASRRETVSQDTDMATLRVNYRWGGPVVAKH